MVASNFPTEILHNFLQKTIFPKDLVNEFKEKLAEPLKFSLILEQNQGNGKTMDADLKMGFRFVSGSPNRDELHQIVQFLKNQLQQNVK